MSDPFLNDVVSLMSFDGDLSDFTGKSWSGTASTSTAQKKFGSASLRTTKGTGAQFIEGPTSDDWAFGTGDFTVECWVQADGITTGFWHSPMGNWSANSGWCFFIDNLARLRFHLNGASISGGVISANTWHHIVAQRSGTDLTIYIDGVVAATSTNSTNITRTDGVRIGQNRVGNNDGLPGHVDEMRVTKGVARYSGAFTPPNEPFPRSLPPDPTSTSTGEVTGTGTGTGSTGAPQQLTPLNLFLVSMSLPDEPAVEPEPEPALPPLFGDFVDYWGLNESSGSVATGINGGHWTIIDGAQFSTADKILGAGALESASFTALAGRQVFYEDDTLFPSSPPWSVSIWWKETAVGDNPGTLKYAIGRGATTGTGFRFRLGVLTNLNETRFVLRNAANTDTTTLSGPRTYGSWQHVVAVYGEDGDARLYVNGALADSTSVAPTGLQSSVSESAPRMFGDFNTTSLLGFIDDVGVWHRALSAEDVTELYNSGEGLAP